MAILLGMGPVALWGADTTNRVVDGFGTDALEHIKTRVAVSVSNALSEASSTKAAEVASMDLLDDKQSLGAGDRVSFRIVEDGDDPKAIIVSDSGELEIPYLGRISALGRTCKALSAEIKALLEKEFYYEATVILAVDQLNRSRGKVYLVGQVRGAGPQDIPSDEVFTLSKAILRAGGFSDFADKKRVRITRKSNSTNVENVTLIVDVSEIFERGKTDKDEKLHAGDLIYIPARLINL